MADKTERIMQTISKELSITYKQIQNVIELLEGGNTVPFIARYRKEQTGALDEVQIRDISEKWQYIQNLEARKEEVIRLIEEQGKLTPELKKTLMMLSNFRKSRISTGLTSKNAEQKRQSRRKKVLNLLQPG